MLKGLSTESSCSLLTHLDDKMQYNRRVDIVKFAHLLTGGAKDGPQGIVVGSKPPAKSSIWSIWDSADFKGTGLACLSIAMPL